MFDYPQSDNPTSLKCRGVCCLILFSYVCQMEQGTILKRIRFLIGVFIIATFISGLTAFPVQQELEYILSADLLHKGGMLNEWLQKVLYGVKETHANFPFLFYGYDWLAFAHIVIALLFYGVYKHPVKNIWIIQWGMITSIAIIPTAFICGFIRGIPIFHILIDCSFGIAGFLFLVWTLLLIKKITPSSD